jgi:hypothetical protein
VRQPIESSGHQIPEPQYTRRDIDQMRSTMSNLRRQYTFRRGAPPTKTPDSNTKNSLNGHFRTESELPSRVDRVLGRIAANDVAEAVIEHNGNSQNGHFMAEGQVSEVRKEIIPDVYLPTADRGPDPRWDPIRNLSNGNNGHR